MECCRCFPRTSGEHFREGSTGRISAKNLIYDRISKRERQDHQESEHSHITMGKTAKHDLSRLGPSVMSFIEWQSMVQKSLLPSLPKLLSRFLAFPHKVLPGLRTSVCHGRFLNKFRPEAIREWPMCSQRGPLILNKMCESAIHVIPVGSPVICKVSTRRCRS